MDSDQIDKISYMFNEITKILEENKVEQYEGKLDKANWRFKLGKITELNKLNSGDKSML